MRRSVINRTLSCFETCFGNASMALPQKLFFDDACDSSAARDRCSTALFRIDQTERRNRKENRRGNRRGKEKERWSLSATWYSRFGRFLPIRSRSPATNPIRKTAYTSTSTRRSQT